MTAAPSLAPTSFTSLITTTLWGIVSEWAGGATFCSQPLADSRAASRFERSQAYAEQGSCLNYSWQAEKGGGNRARAADGQRKRTGD
eukprot:8930821-Pyramimonas_sp.AAC.1